MRRAGTGVVAILAAVCAIVVAGCGGESGGPVTLNYYGPLDPGGTNVNAGNREPSRAQICWRRSQWPFCARCFNFRRQTTAPSNGTRQFVSPTCGV